MNITDIPIILTNIFGIFSIVYALQTNRYIQSIFISYSAIISLIYHFLWSINTNNSNVELIRYYHTFLDYYHINLALISVIVSMYKIKNSQKETLIIILLSCIFLSLNLIISIF